MGTEYVAFMSYSHKDKPTARRLQLLLEHRPVPRRLKMLARTPLDRMYPVFRDDTGLSGTMLLPAIRKALSHSSHLIVLCTRHGVASRYVNTEVEYFAGLGREQQIIPVVVESRRSHVREVTDWYPDALRRVGKTAEDAIVFGPRGYLRASLAIMCRILDIADTASLGRYLARRAFRTKALFICLATLALVLCVQVARGFVEECLQETFHESVSYLYEMPVFPKREGLSRLIEKGRYRESRCLSPSDYLFVVKDLAATDDPRPFALLLLDADMAEYRLDQNLGQVSMKLVQDRRGTTLFVKNYGIDMGIVDLTADDGSPTPYFLPPDMSGYALGGTSPGFSCRIAQVYDEQGRIREMWYLSDSRSLMVPDANGYFGHRYDRDEDGVVTSISFLDEDGDVMHVMRIGGA